MRWHFQSRLMSENGGGADILCSTTNRPLLTLNGHPGAVQRMPAPSPLLTYGDEFG